MLALKIAFRNLRAHSRRNAIILAVTGAVSLFLFLFLSFSDGEIENIKNGVSSFWTPYADIKVVPAQNTSLDHPLTATQDLVAQLAKHPDVTEVFARIWNLWGIDGYVKGKKYLGFSLQELDSRDRTLHSRIRITGGRDLNESDRDQILVHERARVSMGVSAGDEVTLVGKDFFGQVASRRVTIAGFFEPLLDNPNLYATLLLAPTAMSALCGYSEGEANQIFVRLRPGVDPHRVLEQLQHSPGGKDLRYYLPTEDEFENGNTMVFQMVRLILIAMVLITLVITAFGIMNVVAVNLFDRKKEIGTYFCLGSEKPFLLATYTIEIFAVNLGGSLLGVLVGLLVREGINALKLTTSDPGLQVVMGGSQFTLGLSASTLLWIVGGISLVTLVTAVTTLGKALNVSPVVAVKETE